MRTLQRTLLTLSVLLMILALNGSTTRGATAARISISPWGKVFPPAHISIVVHIDRDTANRSASIILQSDSYFSESDVELDGASAPFLISREVNGLGVGNYQAFLELRQWTGSSWKTLTAKSERLEVVGF